jgi:hypothetical protein
MLLLCCCDVLQPSPEKGTAAGLRGDALFSSGHESVLETDCGGVHISGSSGCSLVSTASSLALPPSPALGEASPRSRYNSYLSWAQLRWPAHVEPGLGTHSDKKVKGISSTVLLQQGELLSSAHGTVVVSDRDGAGMRGSRSPGDSCISTGSSLVLPPSADVSELSPRRRYECYFSWAMHYQPGKKEQPVPARPGKYVEASSTEVMMIISPQRAPCNFPDVTLAMLLYAIRWLQTEHEAARVGSSGLLSSTVHSDGMSAGPTAQGAH